MATLGSRAPFPRDPVTAALFCPRWVCRRPLTPAEGGVG